MDKDLPLVMKSETWFICGAITTENILYRWIRRLVNHHTLCVEKWLIMLRNNTLCICHRLLYMMSLIKWLGPVYYPSPANNNYELEMDPAIKMKKGKPKETTRPYDLLPSLLIRRIQMGELPQLGWLIRFVKHATCAISFSFLYMLLYSTCKTPTSFKSIWWLDS